MTLQPRNRVNDTLKRLPPDARICDVGAGGRKIASTVFTIDGFVRENTDLVCNIHDIPLPDGSFEGIFCTGTLEHVEDPKKVLSEIYRLLTKGGIVHVEVPFIQGYHADPHDYWRWTGDGLRLICRGAGFMEVESGSHIGPTSALNWVLNEYVICILGNGIIGNSVASLLRCAFLPLLYIDYLLFKKESAQRIASGVYFVGKK